MGLILHAAMIEAIAIQSAACNRLILGRVGDKGKGHGPTYWFAAKLQPLMLRVGPGLDDETVIWLTIPLRYAVCLDETRPPRGPNEPLAP